jgi:Rieske Fe-S protein
LCSDYFATTESTTAAAESTTAAAESTTAVAAESTAAAAPAAASSALPPQEAKVIIEATNKNDNAFFIFLFFKVRYKGNGFFLIVKHFLKKILKFFLKS